MKAIILAVILSTACSSDAAGRAEVFKGFAEACDGKLTLTVRIGGFFNNFGEAKCEGSPKPITTNNKGD